MNQSTITIDVSLDNDKIPEQLRWKATQSSADQPQDAKAMMLSFWDGQDKAALRIDLWTKDMMVDEMADFVYQNMMSMADNFERATRQVELAKDMKVFARAFIRKFQQNMEKQAEQSK